MMYILVTKAVQQGSAIDIALATAYALAANVGFLSLYQQSQRLGLFTWSNTKAKVYRARVPCFMFSSNRCAGSTCLNLDRKRGYAKGEPRKSLSLLLASLSNLYPSSTSGNRAS